MPRNLVLFDLEWNIGYQPYTFNYHGVQQTFRGEIVEIGAVKIDEGCQRAGHLFHPSAAPHLPQAAAPHC